MIGIRECERRSLEMTVPSIVSNHLMELPLGISDKAEIGPPKPDTVEPAVTEIEADDDVSDQQVLLPMAEFNAA